MSPRTWQRTGERRRREGEEERREEEEEKTERRKETEQQGSPFFSLPPSPPFHKQKKKKSKSRLVMPRPEGVRCLLVSGRGKTVARGRNGAVLHEFASLLPGGGGGASSGSGVSGGGSERGGRAPLPPPPPSSSASEGSCVLDAVFQPDPSPSNSGNNSLPGTFYPLDVLSWGGRDLTGCDAAFRLSFWLPTKLAEAGCCRSSGSSAAPPPSLFHLIYPIGISK